MNNNMIKVMSPYTGEVFEMTSAQIEAAYRYQQRMYLSEDFKNYIDEYHIDGDIDDNTYDILMNSLDDLVDEYDWTTDANMAHNDMIRAIIENYI